jgi:1-phosphatidylinositol phosphodiesterase
MAASHLLLSFGPCIIGSCYRGYGSTYSFNADEARHPTWMAALPDAVNLSSLSIPGTHDTMTYGRLASDEHLQCQNWNLTVQLEAGLRYFDIRARLRDDRLHIYHANGDTGFGFDDVMRDVFLFLDEYPSEAVVLRLKEEGRPLGDKNTITFEDAFNYYRFNASSGIADGFKRHLYPYDPSAPLPTLGALRSRVFLLQEFHSPRSGPYGLDWDGPRMALEDLWIIPDVYHLADKWTAVRDALERAATDVPDNQRLYLAHLSASVGVLPIEAAAGPMNRTIEGINDVTGQWLDDFGGGGDVLRTGIVIADFPGKKLIESVLAWNEPLMP